MARLGVWTLVLLLLAQAARGGEITVRMVTDGERGRFRFEPQLVWIQVGDRVRFVPDSHLHGTRTIPAMLPAGAAGWSSPVGEPHVVVFDQPGIYAYKCPSHYSLGMVGLIVVGDPAVNFDEARRMRHPPKAQAVFARLFAAVACLMERGGEACPGALEVMGSPDFRKAQKRQ